jgi:DNA-binding MarR family transcriptional regulator
MEQRLTPEQEETAIQALTRLGRVPCFKKKELGVREIAAALLLTPAQSADVLADLERRKLIEFRIDPIGGPLESHPIQANLCAWFRVSCA